MTRIRALLAVVAAAVVPASLLAQTPDSLSLEGRNVLMFGIGLTGARQSAASPGRAATHTTGQVASFAFTHFIRPEVAIEISGAALDADANAGAGAANADAVTPLLFGVSYSPRVLAYTPTLRQYFSVAVGPYFREVSNASSGSGASSLVQSNLGARVGTGMNWFVSRHFALQLEADYHAVGSFAAVNGIKKDPAGLALSLGLGFGWGGR